MPILVHTSSSAPTSQKGPATFGSPLEMKGQSLEFSPCSSPGPAEHPVSSLKRRLRREPVRGPESADDSRFNSGITFSFAPTDKSSFLRVIKQEFDSLLSQEEYRPVVYQTLTPEASGHESEASESEFEVDDMSAELDELYEERDDSRAVSRKPTTAPSTPAGVSRKTKQCACCGCTSTPLWRDMGKDMPLCNACGIRWKKYGVVCDVCQYVPCKQERESKTCKRCQAALPPSTKRARAASPQTVPKKL
eukprot:m.220178 g.220178  ORF g.220178 m.220178 type:complete len:249 (+) comp10327_c0_seq1:85-831(+)